MTDRQDNIFSDHLDQCDLDILSMLQNGLKLTCTPFNDIADLLQLDRHEVLNRISFLLKRDVLREISPVFEAKKLGYASSLIAASVPQECLAEFVEYINSLPGVSHNYGRTHDLNVWFTLTLPAGDCKSEDVFSAFLADISGKFGLDSIISLPVLKMYKLKVHFGKKGGKTEKMQGNYFIGHSAFYVSEITDIDRDLIRTLQRGIPVIERPYAGIAESLNDSCKFGCKFTEHDILEKLKAWQQHGVVRRVAGRVRHYNLGYNANAMVVFALSPDLIPEAAAKLVQNDFVSHCYHRQRNELWQYDLYAMVHASSGGQLEKLIALMQQQVGNFDYFAVLNTTCEYKKESVKYFC